MKDLMNEYQPETKPLYLKPSPSPMDAMRARYHEPIPNPMYDTSLLKEREAPEFVRLYNTLNDRIERIEKLSYELESFANRIMPLPVVNVAHTDQFPESEGMLSQFWIQVEKLSEIHRRLEATNNHFSKLI